jgi:hypothetical protein
MLTLYYAAHTCALALHIGVDPGRLPNVIDHRRRVSQRPAVQKAIAAELA